MKTGNYAALRLHLFLCQCRTGLWNKMEEKQYLKNNKQSGANTHRIFLLIFLISIAVRCFLMLYPKRASIYYDELIIQELAQNICRYGTLTVYHVPLNYSKVLYPLLISPFYLIQNAALRMDILSIFNAVLISSALIPGYLLARKLLDKPWKINIAVLILAVSPYMGLGAASMAESLYYPLVLWCFYLAVKGFEKKSIANSILTGFGCCLLYLTKETGAAFFVAILLPEVYNLMAEREKRREHIVSVLCLSSAFLIPYLAIRFIVLGGQGYTYGQQASLDNLGTSASMLFFLTSGLSLIAYFMLAWLFFPILMPAWNFRMLSGKARRLFLLSGIYVLCIAFGAAFGISVYESFPNLAELRIHLRYFIAAGYPFILLFLVNADKEETVSRNKAIPAAILLTAVFSALLIGFPCAGSTVDFPPLYWVTNLATGISNISIWIKVVAILFMFVFLVLRPSGRMRFLTALPVLLICVELISYTTFYTDLKNEQQVTDQDLIKETDILDKTLDELEGNSLVICQEYFDPKLMTMNSRMNDDYYMISSQEYRKLYKESYPDYTIFTDQTDFTCPIRSFETEEVYHPENIRNIICFDPNLQFDPESCENITPEGVQTARVLRLKTAGKIDMHNPLEYTPGTVISFAGEHAETMFYQISGFANAEPSFTWSNSEESVISLRPTTDRPVTLEAVWIVAMTWGEQNCRIYAGSELVFEGIVSGGEYPFTIPARLWNEDQTVTLYFVYSNPASPGGGDKRELAVAFQSLILNETKSLEYTYGTEISFNWGHPEFADCMISGFSGPEAGFTWTNGEEAIIRITPVTETDWPEDLKATWTIAVTNGEQRCRIWSGEEQVYDGVVTEGIQTFEIPASSWEDEEVIELRFELPDAREPGNGDMRQLAVAFQSLTLSPIEEGEQDQ